MEGKRPREVDIGIKQIPYRIHVNDKAKLLHLLGQDKLSFQSLVDAAVQAYIRGDREILKVIDAWENLNELPKEERQSGLLSRRERQDLLNLIERG